MAETTAAQLLRRAHATADVDELAEVGCDLADSDEAGGAEYCFRQAVESGDTLAEAALRALLED